VIGGPERYELDLVDPEDGPRVTADARASNSTNRIHDRTNAVHTIRMSGGNTVHY